MRTAKIGPDLKLIGLGKKFFPKPLVIEFFFLTYNSVIFFSALYAMKDTFFSVGIFFRQEFPCKSSKVKWSAP